MRILAVVGLIVAFSAALVVGGAALLGRVVDGDSPALADPGTRTSSDASSTVAVDPAADAASAPPITTVAAAFDPLPADVDYVALGDSFAAGLGIAPQRTEQPACGRSASGYAARLAGALDAVSFVDVACAGATTFNVSQVQNTDDDQRPAPQHDALSRDTDLVTLTFGGNDYDIFGKIVGSCVRLASLEPDGAPCRDSYAGTGPGDDPAASAGLVERNLRAMLADVADRAPRARVVVVGYPTFFPQSTCTALGFTDADAAFAAAVFDDLDDAMARAATDAGVQFVDTRPMSAGHDICSTSPWVAGYEPTSDAPAAWHPGSSYVRALAARLIDLLATDR